jgi:hypothetical protein
LIIKNSKKNENYNEGIPSIGFLTSPKSSLPSWSKDTWELISLALGQTLCTV